MAFTQSVLLLAALAGVAMSKTLMLGGGYISESSSIIWNKAVTLAGGRGVAKIGIITAASSQAITQGREYKSMFESYGVKEAYWIPIHENNLEAASEADVIKNIKRMTGFFFGGGAQQKYIETLMKDRKPTPALAAIKNMYDAGTFVMGTSAGAMVMPSDYNVVDGTSYRALQSGAIRVGENTDENDLTYDPQGGFGFIEGHIIDSHFSERGRQGRLIRLISDLRGDNSTDYGFGIDEETAVVITNVGAETEMGEVIGIGGVTYIDVSKSYIDSSDPFWRILSVFCHYAKSGDMINFNQHTVTFPNKELIKGNETDDYASTSSNIFMGSTAGSTPEFRRVAESLFNSRYDSVTYGTTLEFYPMYYVIMTEDSLSKGYLEYENDVPRISYLNMKVELRSEIASEDEDD